MAEIIIMSPTTSIFDSRALVLVNPVNTQGRSGKGLALKFAKRYPETEREFVAWCHKEKRSGGDYCKFTSFKHPDKLIIYACTKEDPPAPSKLEWIERFIDGVDWEWLANGYYSSFAIPALGCGLGGLKWDKVRPIIEARFAGIDCIVELYPPR